MNTSPKLLSFLIYIVGCLAQSDSFFDIDELKRVNYGIDILNEPVVMKPKNEAPSNVVFLTSKYGQQYQCTFPGGVDADTEEKAEKVAIETGIPDLLKPMEDEPCLHKTKDWWSYELCYGKHVRQFHMNDDGGIEGAVLVLGLYESEFNWNDGDQSEKDKAGTRMKKYHTQQYVNGSRCDLNGKLRRTEVRFVCEEGSGDYISRLDEPEVCAYIMTVHTTKICHHPYLKPPQPRRTLPITCSPLLSVVQYQQYLHDIEVAEEKAREEERLRQELLEREERLQKEHLQKERLQKEHLRELHAKYRQDRQQSAKGIMNEGDFDIRSSNSYEDGIVEEEVEETSDIGDDGTADSHTWSEVLKAAGGDVGATRSMFKVIESPDDVKDFLREAVAEMKKSAIELDGGDSGDGNPGSDDGGAGPPGVGEGQEDEDEDVESYVDEEEDFLKDVAAELRTIKQKYQHKKEKLTELKEKVRTSMEEQYDTIVKEAREELAAEEAGVEVDIEKKKAFNELTETLNTLLKKLDSTEKEISAVDKELDNFVSYDNEATNTQTNPRAQSPKSPPLKDTDSRDTIQFKQKSAQGPSKSLSKPDDDRVKVRITRLSRDMLSARDGDDDEEISALEEGVEKELQAAGFDGTNKIQVKIITAGYYDEDDNTLHVLSEEESESFKNMIVSLIGGTSEASKEEVIHSQMEDNYSFVWGQDRPGDTTQAPATTDPQTDTQTDVNPPTGSNRQTDIQTEEELEDS